MGFNSINTNDGALRALQTLSATQAELITAQGRINTGKKVANAKDNGAVWAIAQNQRATSRALDAVRESLQRGQSMVDVALAGGETVSDLLLQMKEKALAASDASLDSHQRDSLNQGFIALRDQIAKAVRNATFNGINMLDGGQAGGAASIAPLAGEGGGARLTVSAQDLSLGGGGALSQVTATASIGTQTLAGAMIAVVGGALGGVSTALSQLGTGSKALAAHLSFVEKLQDSVDMGVGGLVDADLAKEAARLTALQTRQSLNLQALSIANRAPQFLSQLFRTQGGF